MQSAPLERDAEETLPTGEARAPLVLVEGASLLRPKGGPLQGFDLAVYPGEVVLLCGPSGSGKTEVLRAALGLSLPLEGEVRLFGERVRRLHHDALMALRQRTAYASITAPLLANQSVRENLSMPLVMRGFSVEKAREEATAMMDALSLSPFADERPHRLPHLVHHRAVLARALALPVDLLVLDEPLLGTEAEEREQALSLVAARARAGVGVLVATSHPEAFGGLAARRVWLDAISDRPADGVACGAEER